MKNTVGLQKCVRVRTYVRVCVCAGLVQESDGIVILCAEVSLHNSVGIGGGGADCVHVRCQRGVQGDHGL